MKRILIDATTVQAKTDGLSQYIVNVVKHLFRNSVNKNINYILLVRPAMANWDWCEEYSFVEVRYVYIQPIGLKREFKLSYYLFKHRKEYDVSYFPSNQYPLFYRGGVYTIHDIIYERFPQQLGKLWKLKKMYLHLNVHHGLRSSTDVISVSNYTQCEVEYFHGKFIESKYGRPHIIYEGWEHLATSVSNEININCPFEKYFFYVGSSRGHKNLGRLLQAFSFIVDKLSSEWGLVIVGKSNRLTAESVILIDKINSQSMRVFLTDWITDNELSQYFKNSSCLVFPSLSEGFGIPIIEAFYNQIPVVCSDNTVFPEIAKDAAIYFNPLDIDDIASKLLEFANIDSEYSVMLINRGNKYLKEYSWDEASKKILNILLSK